MNIYFIMIFLVRLFGEACPKNCGAKLLKLSISTPQASRGIKPENVACPMCSDIWEMLHSTALGKSTDNISSLGRYGGDDHNDVKTSAIAKNTLATNSCVVTTTCKCGFPVVTRTVKAGENSGKPFLCCSKERCL